LRCDYDTIKREQNAVIITQAITKFLTKPTPK
jgi:hypothetical protein